MRNHHGHLILKSCGYRLIEMAEANRPVATKKYTPIPPRPLDASSRTSNYELAIINHHRLLIRKRCPLPPSRRHIV